MSNHVLLYHNRFNIAIKKCDLLIALGTRFGVQQTGATLEKYTTADVIRVEIDENEIGRTFINEKLVIKSDLKSFFTQVNKQCLNFDSNYQTWHLEIQNWENKFGKNICAKNEKIDPIDFIQELSKYYEKNSVITADVGANQMWVAQAFKVNFNQRFLTSSALGSMGYSLPAAIGASYGIDDVVVFQDGNQLIVHRIVKIEGEEITTAGDANDGSTEKVGW